MSGAIIDLCDSDSDSDVDSFCLTRDRTIVETPAKHTPIKPSKIAEAAKRPKGNDEVQQMVELPRNKDSDDSDEDDDEFLSLPVCRPKSFNKDDDTRPSEEFNRHENDTDSTSDRSVIEILDDTVDDDQRDKIQLALDRIKANVDLPKSISSGRDESYDESYSKQKLRSKPIDDSIGWKQKYSVKTQNKKSADENFILLSSDEDNENLEEKQNGLSSQNGRKLYMSDSSYNDLPPPTSFKFRDRRSCSSSEKNIEITDTASSRSPSEKTSKGYQDFCRVSNSSQVNSHNSSTTPTNFARGNFQKTWTCNICTLHNNTDLQDCDACGSPSPFEIGSNNNALLSSSRAYSNQPKDSSPQLLANDFQSAQSGRRRKQESIGSERDDESSFKASRGDLKQSPRGGLKDDRNYDDESDDSSSTSSWNFTYQKKIPTKATYKDGANDSSTSSWNFTYQKKIPTKATYKDGANDLSGALNASIEFDSDNKSLGLQSPYKVTASNHQSCRRSKTSVFDLDSDSGLSSAPFTKNTRRIKTTGITSVKNSRRVRDSDVSDLLSPEASFSRGISRQSIENISGNTDNLFGSDLLSPEASVGRTSVSSAISASSTSSRKVKVPTPAIPVKITTAIGGKLYPDLRHHFIKALIKQAKIARRAIHTKNALNRIIWAINTLALHSFPIRSADCTKGISHIGEGLLSTLKEAEKDISKTKRPYHPPGGLVSSASAAALIVLLDYEVGKDGENRFITLEDLIRKINRKAHCTTGGKLFNRDIEYYLAPTNFDPGFLQIRKLCNDNFVKERKRKSACQSGLVYELLDKGRQQASTLKLSLAEGPTPDGPLRQLAASTVPEEYGNVTVVIDGREGGGGYRKLHDFCDFLDNSEVPYVVRNLKISDYVFFVGNKLAPVLIERKSIEDVAHSLFDGRWEKQQHNMRKAQYVLGGGEARKCHLCYLIEGDIDRTITHGGFVGRSNHRKTVQDVKDAITSLPELGFSVIESKNKYGSLLQIQKIAKDFLWRSNNGSIDCAYTYEEFVDALKHISNDKGNPPTDARHKNPAPPIVDQAPTFSTYFPNCSNSSDENHARTESEGHKQKREDLMKLSAAELKEKCRERTEKVTGSKKDLVERLLQKRKPELLITRTRRKQYVPKVPSCNAAILVALHLEAGPKPMEKQQIMERAEETGVSKDPMFGKGKGQFNYDGWSGLKDLTGGDPPLISVVKRKYALTTQPRGSAGVDVARAIHIMAHRQNLCRCGQYVDTS